MRAERDRAREVSPPPDARPIYPPVLTRDGHQARPTVAGSQPGRSMATRVVTVGTGLVGREAVRALMDGSDTELVAHVVHDPAKAHRDVGDLVG